MSDAATVLSAMTLGLSAARGLTLSLGLALLAVLHISPAWSAERINSMNRSSGAALDPYILPEPDRSIAIPGYQNIDGRTPSSSYLDGTKKNCIIVAFGQSNAMSNYDIGAYTILNPTKIDNLNIYDGAVYRSAAPMLGTGGTLENWGNRTADNLIADGTCDRVILVSASISNTLASDWASGGAMSPRIAATAKRIAALGWQASVVIWQQGESDTAAGTSQPAYAASLASVISIIQANFPGVPLFISQTSWYLGTTSANITNPQVAAINGTTIFSLGNSDLIGVADRDGGNHFSATGAASWGSTTATNLAAHLVVRP